MKKRFLRMRKILLPMILALVLSMVIVLGGTASPTSAITQMDPTTTVYLDPPRINGTAVAQVFTVDINIRDSPNMTEWKAAVTFNANLLECIGFDEGEFLSKGIPGKTWWTRKINNTLGVITARCTLLGIGAKESGSGRLAYATFRVIALGVSDLHLRDVQASEWIDSTEIKIPINIIDVYTVVVDTIPHTVVTVSNSTGKNEYGSGFYDHAFSIPDKEISFNVTGPYSGFSNVTIPKTLLPPPEHPLVWTVIINSVALKVEERIVTENDTHTSIYFTYPAGVNDVQITTRFMSSTISISLSEDSISLGESVTISGTIDPLRENATVNIKYRLTGGNWTTLANVKTDSNSNYDYTWAPPENGTYEVKASWLGDEVTSGAESDVLTLTVKWSSVISIVLSSTNITLGESVTISGNITVADSVARAGVNVTILYRLSGAADWTTLTTVETDETGNYSYPWTPDGAGTHDVKAGWLGDEVTSGAESDVLTLTVKWSSTISIAISSANITKGKSVTISGNITVADNTGRADASVTILYRLSGAVGWDTLATVETNQNGEYTYPWTPDGAGTYDVKARWDGDDVTFGNESDVLTLTVEKAAAGISIEIVIATVVAVVVIAAVVIYYFVRIRK